MTTPLFVVLSILTTPIVVLVVILTTPLSVVLLSNDPDHTLIVYSVGSDPDHAPQYHGPDHTPRVEIAM